MAKPSRNIAIALLVVIAMLTASSYSCLFLSSCSLFSQTAANQLDHRITWVLISLSKLNTDGTM